MATLRLFSRRDCHLCDAMELELERLRNELRIDWQKIDVDTDPVLVSRYGERVPVLSDDRGTEICHYRLDESALRNALR